MFVVLFVYSSQDTVPDTPDSLFFLPKQHRPMPNLLHKVTEADIQRLVLVVVQGGVPNEYHEYFDYDIRRLDIESRKDWRDAYQLYCKLIMFNYVIHQKQFWKKLY